MVKFDILKVARFDNVSKELIEWFLDQDVFRKIDPGSSDETIFDIFCIEGVPDDLATKDLRWPEDPEVTNGLKSLIAFCQNEGITWVELHSDKGVNYSNRPYTLTFDTCNQLATLNLPQECTGERAYTYRKGENLLKYLIGKLTDRFIDFRVTYDDSFDPDRSMARLTYPKSDHNYVNNAMEEYLRPKETGIKTNSESLAAYRTDDDGDGGMNVVVVEAENEDQAWFHVHSNGYGQIYSAYDCTGQKFDRGFDLIHIDVSYKHTETNLYFFIHSWGLDV